MKSIKLFKECENEIEISEKIREIPFFFWYYSLIKSYKKIKVSEIGSDFLENVENHDYVLIERERLYYSSFSHFFQTITNKREKILHFFDSYLYLLKSIALLNKHSIVYFNINDEKIGFNTKKQPILLNFSESFCRSQVFKNGFPEHNPAIFSLPLEVHIITFMNTNANTNNKVSISQENIELVCKEFIVKNYALKGLSEDFIKKFYKSCVLQALSFSIINQAREKIIEKMALYSDTWDNYSVSALFLPIVTKICETMENKCSFFSKFSQLLLLNMDPDPEKRLNPEETIERFQSLFEESDQF
jgi:hypothetical protein